MVRSLARQALAKFGLRVTLIEQPLKVMIPEISDEQVSEINVSAKYSMTGKLRMWSLVSAIEYCAKAGIEGEIVECGVWRGGNLILSQLVSRRIGRQRKVWGYDTFAGMTSPEAADVRANAGTHAGDFFEKSQKEDHNDWCYSAIDEVKANLDREVPGHDVKLVKGPVEETLAIPGNYPDKIAILRLDTDWYASTKMELEVLYPRLVTGGVLMIDDYGEWAGARQAVDEYFAGQGVWLHYVDHSMRMLIKR